MKIEITEDKFNLDSCIKPLTKLIQSINDEPFVMTVTAPYGSGKTFFINYWKNSLNTENLKTFYYNAWENDLSNNPLMSFIANFKDLGLNSSDWKDLIKNTATVLATECISRPELIGNLATYISESTILGNATKTAIKTLNKTVKLSKNVFQKIDTNSLFRQQIEEESKKKEQIEQLKKSLSKIIQKNNKLIIFIDDLDRCSPQYTIRFLEYIKHIFDISNCIFVLAVDEEQLQSSVETFYGNKNATDFLSKIIDFKFKLPAPNISELLQTIIQKQGWTIYFQTLSKKLITNENKIKNFIDIFEVLKDIFKLTARDIIHICQDLNIIFKSHDEFTISPIYILLVYTIENYQYKIQNELQPYLANSQFNIINALTAYCKANSYEIKDYKPISYSNYTPGDPSITIQFSSSFTDFLSFLDYKDVLDQSANKCEKFYALSKLDFDSDKGCRDLYKRTKKIIQDVIYIDENRKVELQNEQELISEKKVQNTFKYGTGIFDV